MLCTPGTLGKVNKCASRGKELLASCFLGNIAACEGERETDVYFNELQIISETSEKYLKCNGD